MSVTPVMPTITEGDSPRGRARAIIDQWHGGTPADTRAALTQFPDLRLDRSIVLEFAYEEFVLRTAAGETIDAAEFADRFPEYRASILSILRAHQLLEGANDIISSLPEFRWPEPGEEILGYCVIRPLGIGGFARVYLASHPVTGQLRVLKVAPADVHEVRVMAGLDHPNVAAVHDARRHGAMLAIVMPFLGSATLNDVFDVAHQPGGSKSATPVKDALDRGSRPEERPTRRQYLVGIVGEYHCAIATIAHQVALGLAHLHEQGIWHRDLKPSNVVLAWDGRPVIVDFNLAVSSGDNPGRAGGTMPYMAPEHLLAATGRGPVAAVDGRSDLFSLGVVVYELLAGRHPFGSPPSKNDPSEPSATIGYAQWLWAQHRRGAVPLKHWVPSIDPRWNDLIGQCLQFDPNLRPATARQVSAVLQQILSPRVRRSSLVYAAIAAGVLAAGIGAWSVARPSPRDSGFAAFRTGAMSHAIEQLTDAAADQPNDPELFLVRGAARLRANDPFEAASDFRKAEQLGLRDGRVLAALAYCEALSGNHRVAIAHSDAAEQLGFDAPALFSNRAYSRICLPNADLEAAVHDADSALRREPNLISAHEVRSIALYRQFQLQGRTEASNDRALFAIRGAINAGSRTPAVHRYGAELLLVQRHPSPEAQQLALEWLQQAADLGLDCGPLERLPWIKLIRHRSEFRQLLSRPSRSMPSSPGSLLSDPLLSLQPR